MHLFLRRFFQGGIVFFFTLFLFGQGIPPARAGFADFVLTYVCPIGRPGRPVLCPEATAVWYNFSAGDTYTPGQTISVDLSIGSDDHPVEPLCPFVSLGINNSNYTGDLIPGCYTARDLRGGTFLSFTMTAPLTPGPFTLNISVGLSGYRSPSVKSIPLTVVAAPVPAATISAAVIVAEAPTWWGRTLAYLTGRDHPAYASGPNATISTGGTARISWNALNATTCSIRRNGIPFSTALNGSQDFSGLLAGTYTFTISCSGPGGSANDSVQVIVIAPAASFNSTSFAPSSVNVGGSSTLSWSTSNATSLDAWCDGATAADNAWRQIGISAGSTSKTVTATAPMAGTTANCHLQAYGPGGASGVYNFSWAVNTAANDGVCAISHYNCGVGTSINNSDNFNDWTWTCQGSGAGLSPSCLENKTQTITASAGAGGIISPSGNVVVNRGTSPAFTITPSGGYNISSVIVDGWLNVGPVSSYTFNSVTSNHSIAASFTASCAPNQGSACTSALNVCGMTNTGSIDCSGTCSASTPADSLCPPPSPSVTFTINGSTGLVSLTRGDARNFAWSVSNASSCTAFSNDGWAGSKSVPNGNESLSANVTSNHTLQCSGPGGTTSKSVLVNVSCVPSTGNYGACNCTNETKTRTNTNAACLPWNEATDCSNAEKNICRTESYNWKEVAP